MSIENTRNVVKYVIQDCIIKFNNLSKMYNGSRLGTSLLSVRWLFVPSIKRKFKILDKHKEIWNDEVDLSTQIDLVCKHVLQVIAMVLRAHIVAHGWKMNTIERKIIINDEDGQQIMLVQCTEENNELSVGVKWTDTTE